MSAATLAPRATSTAPATSPVASTRDPWFDSAKMLLVTLVVVGHAWNMDALVGGWVYDYLYLWHVPALVMVTGYLSRSFTFSRRHLSRLVTTVALPYVVFLVALSSYRTHVGGEQLDPLSLDPNWPMWYLSALFLWRLATPLLKRVPHPIALSVVVCLLGGLSTGNTLDLARVMGLLPFFTIGLHARAEHLEMLRRPTARLLAGAAFVLAMPVAVLLHSDHAIDWLYWRSSYGQLDASFLTGAGIRLMLLVVAGTLAVSIFAFVPRRDGWFARMGASTMVVYLFHGFVVKTVSYTGFPGWADSHALPALVLTTVFAVLLALAIAAPPVARRLNVLVDPVGTWRRRRARQVKRVADPGNHEAGTALEGTLAR